MLSRWRRRLEQATRPVHDETRMALAERWRALPQRLQTPEQLLGRFAVGCEGTQGVFPRCNLTCSPCYHSADANKVRVDGAHTRQQVDDQMGLLRARRGPRAHAQLIGGEVSLLAPEDHAAALESMRRHGREPMSMTHGDFDSNYLHRLALHPDGSRRFGRLSFAGHFDSLMRGRRGLPRPRSESELNPFRRRFAEMFRELAGEHGVDYFLAHNMTVTPHNIGQVAAVVHDVVPMGYSMLSFQPAAYVGDGRRWSQDFREVTINDLWEQIEKGMGHPLPWQDLAFGDPRCNRTSWGLLVGDRWIPILEAGSTSDRRARDRVLNHYGGVDFGWTPRPALLVKLGRVLARHPTDMVCAVGWVARAVRRAGGVRRVLTSLTRRRLRPLSFVVHAFMDADDVAPAWELMRAGVTAKEPRVLAAQERLAACTYSMAHPETGELVPACVQHSVLDPTQNRGLRQLLPLNVLTRSPQ